MKTNQARSDIHPQILNMTVYLKTRKQLPMRSNIQLGVRKSMIKAGWVGGID